MSRCTRTATKRGYVWRCASEAVKGSTFCAHHRRRNIQAQRDWAERHNPPAYKRKCPICGQAGHYSVTCEER